MGEDTEEPGQETALRLSQLPSGRASAQIFTNSGWSDFSSESEGGAVVILTLEMWLETGRVLGDFEESVHDSRWKKDH